MSYVFEDPKVFAPHYRAAIEQAHTALGNFLEAAWEFRDEIADEDLLVTRFDEIAEAIAEATSLPLYVVGECLTVIVGVTMPDTEEFEDDIHDLLVRYFLEN